MKILNITVVTSILAVINAKTMFATKHVNLILTLIMGTILVEKPDVSTNANFVTDNAYFLIICIKN
jgi:uncharacterized membrane protein